MRLEDGVSIGDLHVQMRTGRVAAVSQEREEVSSMNAVMQPYFDASLLQVGICDVPIRSNLQDDMVPPDVVECDGRQSTRCVVRYSVHDFRDLSIRDGEERFAPAPPVFIARCAIVTRIAVRTDLDPSRSRIVPPNKCGRQPPS